MRLNWYGWWKVIVELYLGPDADPSKLGAWREASEGSLERLKAKRYDEALRLLATDLYG